MSTEAQYQLALSLLRDVEVVLRNLVAEAEVRWMKDNRHNPHRLDPRYKPLNLKRGIATLDKIHKEFNKL